MRFDIDYLIKTAVDAGREILKVYNSDDFEITEKEDMSPLTKADTMSHNLISERLISKDLFQNTLIFPLFQKKERTFSLKQEESGNISGLLILLTVQKSLLTETGNLRLILHLLKKTGPFLE